ncbi:MAG: single-stranded DNA-binding protein [Acholeplasmatales bacterium]|nr:single-stranded DNA-binding protein [Acholeplasmatales bacterium]
MNKVILIGRITKDPEVRYSQNGTSSYLMFTLAIDRGSRDASGNKQADFINCTAFNQPADFISRFVRKGYLLSVVGRLQNRSYQGQDGQMRYVTEVVVESVENLTPRDSSQPQQAMQPQQPQQSYQGYQNPSYGGYQNPAPNYSQPEPKEEEAPKTFDIDLDDGELPF